jgi:hypothetical protein
MRAMKKLGPADINNWSNSLGPMRLNWLECKSARTHRANMVQQ